VLIAENPEDFKFNTPHQCGFEPRLEQNPRKLEPVAHPLASSCDMLFKPTHNAYPYMYTISVTRINELAM